jgi:uncharacterized damage-inducible protein DinB
MKSKIIIAALLVSGMSAFFFSCGKPATQAAAPTMDRVNMMVKDWERAKKFTQAYLDSANDASIAFKLSDKTPRSFGNQFIHFADANYALVKLATGKATDMGFGVLEGKGPDAFKTKADVSKAVMDSYDFVIAGLKEMNDTQLADTISAELFPGFNVKMTKEMMINKAFEHQTHHRGQTTQYLRAQGLTPPQEMLF